jgi:UDP-galactopyranose mutase
VVDVETILRNVLLREDQVSWGPNNTFKYPLRGGTGHLYEGMRQYVAPNLELETSVTGIDPVAKVVRTADGRSYPYDALLSTMPLNTLLGSIDGVPDHLHRRRRPRVERQPHRRRRDRPAGDSTRTGSTSPSRTCRSTG